MALQQVQAFLVTRDTCALRSSPVIHTKSDHEFCLPVTRLANVPWLCWLATVALGGLYFYFDEFGHGLYRETLGTPDYRAEARIEDNCLWLAGTAATIGVITSVVGLVVIRRSGSRVRGSYRLCIGIVFNLLTALVVLFTLFLREMAKAA